MFRRLVVLSIMTAALLTPTAVMADEYKTDLEVLLETAERDGWGEAEWAWFQAWVDLICVQQLVDRAHNGDHQAVEALIGLVFGAEHAPRAQAIAWRESRYQPWARNPSGASGLFQIMLPLHARRFTAAGYAPEQWSDPAVNVTVAYQLFQEQGWQPWAF